MNLKSSKPDNYDVSRHNFSGFSGLHPVATMVSRQLRHASSSNVKLSTKSSSCRMRSSRAMRKMKALNCTGSSRASLEIKYNQIKFCLRKPNCTYTSTIHQKNKRCCGIYLQNQVAEKHPALIVPSWPASHWGTTKPWVQRRNPTAKGGFQNLRSRTVSRRVPPWPNPRYQKRNKCSFDL